MPRFDWKDSLLIALGFVACVALATFIERAFGIEIEKEILQVLVGVTILGFPALRRRFFGEPDLAAPRKGIFYSLLSIVGLLATIFGMALLAIFGARLLEAPKTPPDYMSQPAEPIEGLDEFQVLPNLDGDSAHDPEQAANDERVFEQFEAEMKAWDDEIYAEWHEQQKYHQKTTRWLTALGLGLVVLGALAAYVRYPRGPQSA